MTDTKRPEVIMEREDYAATFEMLFLDFKARYKIHQYEMNHLMKDLSLLLNALTDKTFYAMTDQ
jgi:outer membrane protease